MKTRENKEHNNILSLLFIHSDGYFNDAVMFVGKDIIGFLDFIEREAVCD